MRLDSFEILGVGPGVILVCFGERASCPFEYLKGNRC